MRRLRFSTGNLALIVLPAVAVSVIACSPAEAASNDPAPPGETASTDPTQPSDLQTAFEALPPGDAARGEQIFRAQPCHVCHVDATVGPAFPGDPALADVAADRKPGYSAELYLYESIKDASAYVVSGYPDGVMPKDIGERLSPQDTADLIAYLMTLH